MAFTPSSTPLPAGGRDAQTTIETSTRNEHFLGTVSTITLPYADTDSEQYGYELNLIDGWVRTHEEWDHIGMAAYWPSKRRSSIAAVLRAVAHDDQARTFAINAHVQFVRAMRAAACMGAEDAARLHARATRQADALTRALATHGRALANVDVLDPRKDQRAA